MKPLKSSSIQKKPISVKFFDIKAINAKKEGFKGVRGGVDRIEEENDEDENEVKNNVMELEGGID